MEREHSYSRPWRTLVSGMGGYHVLRLFKIFGCWTCPSRTFIVSETSAEVPQQLETGSIVSSPNATRPKNMPMPSDATECRCLLGPRGTGTDRLHILWPIAVPESACSTYQCLDFVWFVQLQWNSQCSLQTRRLPRAISSDDEIELAKRHRIKHE